MLKNRITKAISLTLIGTALFSGAALADTYNSSIVLPTVHAKHYTYIGNIPVKGSPPSTGKITNITWNWAVVGWPKDLKVELCYSSASACIDISRIRSGSSQAFNSKSPTGQFYFTLRAAADTPVPVGGQTGVIDLQWNK